MFQDMREFLSYLDRKNELSVVSHPVSTTHEMTELQIRTTNKNGPALLFENALGPNGKRSDYKVLSNLFTTKQRVLDGLGSGNHESLKKLGELMAFCRHPSMPQSMNDLIEGAPILKKILKSKPRITDSPLCQTTTYLHEDVDLLSLPAQTFWPQEPGPLITWGMVVTSDPENPEIGGYNLGIYRMQILDKRRTIMRWLPHRGGAQHFAKWKKSSTEPFPVAVVIAPDPATLLSAVIPAPDNVSEYLLASIISGNHPLLTECLTVPLLVPANAEIIIEGFISLTDLADEGPFVDHTGYLNSVEKFPVFTATALTSRKDPIYMSTPLKRPPDEPSVISEVFNDLFIPILQKQFPEIIDFWLPPEACSYRMAIVSIKKLYLGHAKRIMMGIWSYLRQFSYTKYVVVVDDDINVRDWKDVIWAISTRTDPERDTTIISSGPIDYLDFASPVSGLGSKMGIDATHKWPGESQRVWGKRPQMPDDIVELVNKNWQKYGIKGLFD